MECSLLVFCCRSPTVARPVLLSAVDFRILCCKSSRLPLFNLVLLLLTNSFVIGALQLYLRRRGQPKQKVGGDSRCWTG